MALGAKTCRSCVLLSAFVGQYIDLQEMKLKLFSPTPEFEDGSPYTMKKNTEASRIARKGVGLEVNADKPKYMVMSEN
jgi:hypothetical protein